MLYDKEFNVAQINAFLLDIIILQNNLRRRVCGTTDALSQLGTKWDKMSVWDNKKHLDIQKGGVTEIVRQQEPEIERGRWETLSQS